MPLTVAKARPARVPGNLEKSSVNPAERHWTDALKADKFPPDFRRTIGRGMA
jgi:hypothetical protein